MMNNQEVFDIVVRHLRKQNAASVVSEPGSACAYRGTEGRKCAVGILIPDEIYHPYMEEKSIEYVMAANPETKKWECDMCLLSELMTIHDSYPVNRWEQEFRSVANAYNLTIPD